MDAPGILLLANVAIPSIAIHVVVMLVLLLPVTIAEGIVLMWRHPLSQAEAMGLALRANLRSTLAGLPVGYLCALAGIIPAGIFASLLPPGPRSVIGLILAKTVFIGGMFPNDADDLGFFVGTVLVMLPYYLVTVKVERACLARRRGDLDPERLAMTVRIMNGVTYGLLLIPLLVGMVQAGVRFAAGD
ncbi:MAG: hypothetical protein HZA54_01025 [Planctomycetes bacterium]|nr:hypothetical protein [Planctomycetota bacterium]